MPSLTIPTCELCHNPVHARVECRHFRSDVDQPIIVYVCGHHAATIFHQSYPTASTFIYDLVHPATTFQGSA